ncbi:MAG: hypothetical protein G01um101466_259 [Parcubacteria group bacterium Gr01-1014_66]|nr:MAG: hypothetical protein G01um101466_259 [Parcubacteria group bacterium Gr01-1014_66]
MRIYRTVYNILGALITRATYYISLLQEKLEDDNFLCDDRKEYSEMPNSWHRDIDFFVPSARSQEYVFGYDAQLLVGEYAIASAPRLILSDALFRELHYYFSTSVIEFQLMGLVQQEEDNRFVVKEWVHNPHTAGVVHADLDQDTFPQWLDMLEQEGKDIRLLRVQVHSHGMLDAYFSSVDIATILDAYACDWMISIVGNRAGMILARLDVYEPVPLSISLPIIVESPQFVYSDEEKNTWQQKRNRANKFLTINQGDISDGKFLATT